MRLDYEDQHSLDYEDQPGLDYEDQPSLDYEDQPGKLYSHFCNSKVYIYFNIFFSLPQEMMRSANPHYYYYV